MAIRNPDGRAVVVPLDEAQIEGDRLLVRHGVDQIAEAPAVEDDMVDAETARRLYAHYGIDDSVLRDDSGIATEEGSGGAWHRTGDPRAGGGSDDAAQGHP